MAENEVMRIHDQEGQMRHVGVLQMTPTFGSKWSDLIGVMYGKFSERVVREIRKYGNILFEPPPPRPLICMKTKQISKVFKGTISSRSTGHGIGFLVSDKLDD